MAALATASACASGNSRRSGPDVFLDLQRGDLGTSSLLVFTFAEPAEAAGKGALAATACHELLLAARTFRVVALDARTPWERMGESEESRLLSVLAAGQRQGYDYVAVGEVTDFVYGGSGRARAGARLRIIDTRSRVTVFFAAQRLEEAGHDKSYPLDTRLGVPAPSPEQLLRQALDRILRRLR